MRYYRGPYRIVFIVPESQWRQVEEAGWQEIDAPEEGDRILLSATDVGLAIRGEVALHLKSNFQPPFGASR